MFADRGLRAMKSLRLALARAGLLFLSAFAVLTARPRDRDAPNPAIPAFRPSDLPPEERETLTLIRAGSRFPLARDSSVSTDREGLLPVAALSRVHRHDTRRGDRGACRIVAVKRAEFYYTEDHYRSFGRIIE